MQRVTAVELDYFQIPKNEREVLRVAIRECEGNTFLDLRTHVRQSDGDYGPTRKGCTLNVEHSDAMVEALSVVLDEPTEQIAEVREAAAAALAEHGVPVNWSVIHEILLKRSPELACSKWLLYAAMSSESDVFKEVSPEVFALVRQD